MKSFFKGLFYICVLLLLLSIASGIHHLTSSDEDDNKAGNIAVIEVNGVITESMGVLEQIEEIRKNDAYKAVVVRVDSPGGAVGASQEIYMELKKLKKTKPVIVSMGDLAASGGLYISVAGDSLIALPGTLTGSMGVLIELTNFSKLMEKIYVQPVTIRSGELKDAGNPLRPLDPKAAKYFQELINETFQMFKTTVKEERKLSDADMQMLSDGRVINGDLAAKIKLVDKVGTFQDAVDLAKEKGKISGDVKLAFVSRKPKGIVDKIFEKSLAPVREALQTKIDILQYRFSPKLP